MSELESLRYSHVPDRSTSLRADGFEAIDVGEEPTRQKRICVPCKHFIFKIVNENLMTVQGVDR